jgi:PadR family transcriptional regulator, regulatory protein PadR
MGDEVGPRVTQQMLAVLVLMLDAPTASWYGLEIARKTSLKSGTVYPLLARLEQAGWLDSEFEHIDPTIEKRPRRRLYRLTGLGETAARQRVLEAGRTHAAASRQGARPVRLGSRPRLAGGQS